MVVRDKEHRFTRDELQMYRDRLGDQDSSVRKALIAKAAARARYCAEGGSCARCNGDCQPPPLFLKQLAKSPATA